MSIYLGLLSGTSMDGVDACLVDFSDHGNEQGAGLGSSPGSSVGARLIASQTTPYPDDLLRELRELMQPRAAQGMVRAARLDAWLGEVFAQAANALIAASGIDKSQIRAIGSHGQTLHHAPQIDYPYSLQLGDPHRIAERTGVTVVADFRRRDIAAGGQGAPLVPPAHAALFSHPQEARVIANIGGIANITLLPPSSDTSTPVRGLDTGPGNTLMDAWIMRHQGRAYDENGAWAQSGQVHEELLAALLAEPYFAQAAPKSTGPELFNLGWLEQRGGAWLHTLSPEDVQATLLELSAQSLMNAIRPHAAQRVLFCGGGAYNGALLRRLCALTGGLPIETTAAYGIEPAWVEAVAFAWLARQTMRGLPGNLPSVTGASGLRVLGAIYPG